MSKDKDEKKYCIIDGEKYEIISESEGKGFASKEEEEAFIKEFCDFMDKRDNDRLERIKAYNTPVSSYKDFFN